MSAAPFIPVIVITIPIEGRATVRVWAASFEEQERVRAEIGQRDPLGEIETPLRALLEVLQERREGRA